MKYKGPIVVGSDCTKVRQRLNISTQYGAHILGTTFDLADVEVDDAEDIDEIVDRASKKKAFASQARAILTRVRQIISAQFKFLTCRPIDSTSPLPTNCHCNPTNRWQRDRGGHSYAPFKITEDGCSAMYPCCGFNS